MKIWFTILTVFFVIFITFFVWGRVLNQALIGEGTTYFVEPYASMIEKGGFKELWGRHDVQALLFFEFARDAFRDNMTLYMSVLLLGIIFVGLCIYQIIKKVTGSTFFGLVGSILVIANFIGSFEILGLGYYQWYIQRVPNFGLALLGFIYLIDFFKKPKNNYYFLSLLFYILSVFLSRYTIHALPLFLLYIFFSNKSKFKALQQAVPFIVGSYVLYKAQSLVNSQGLLDFAGNFEAIKNSFNQITFLTIPFLSALPKYFFPGVVQFVTPVVLLIYLGTTHFCIRMNKKLSPILLSLLISIPVSVYLSIFLNPYFANFYDTSRYLYYTSILISIFWGISLYTIFNKNKLAKVVIVLFTATWLIFNRNLILEGFDSWQERHDPVLATIKYLKENSHNLNDKTYILVPKEFGHYGAGMLSYIYKDQGLIFLADLEEEREHLKEDATVLKYDSSLGKTYVGEDFIFSN